MSLFARPFRGPFRLLSRPGCHLCEEMRAAVEEPIREKGTSLEIVVVDSDPALAVRWGMEIPVLLDADGRVVARVKDPSAKIRRRLTR